LSSHVIIADRVDGPENSTETNVSMAALAAAAIGVIVVVACLMNGAVRVEWFGDACATSGCAVGGARTVGAAL
jgi:hypothetical protein